MKERPILMCGPMVSAILEGRKTKTRRVVKPQPDVQGWQDTPLASDSFGTWSYPGGAGGRWKCPHGRAGDLLWVRETFMVDPFREFQYRADGHEFIDPVTGAEVPWKPSIFMPRRASRITLDITGIRIERIRDITEEDAIAEGVTPSIVGADLDHLKYRAGFQTLWEQINGEGSWYKNPWVWVISFKKVVPARTAA